MNITQKMRQNLDINSFQVLILSLTDEPRNKSLINDLLRSGIPAHLIKNIIGFDGHRESFEFAPKVNFLGNKKVLGRDLTPSETACLLGHRLIHSIANSEWLLVLEDDAVLIDEDLYDSVSNLLSNFDSSRPIVISLFAGKNGVIANARKNSLADQGLVRFVKSPTGCVAYLINSKARYCSLSASKLTGVADWPTWISFCEFYQSSRPRFGTLGDQNSYISENMPPEFQAITPHSGKRVLRAVFGLFDSELVKILGGRPRYFKYAIYPVILKSLHKFSLQALTKQFFQWIK